MDKKEILDRFISLYTGLKRAHGFYTTGDTAANGKVGGKARTVNEELTRAKYKDHLSGKIGIGVVPIREDSTCSFGVIDIDEYNGATNHVALERETKKLGLPLIVCRSKSGGAHCYLFLTEPIPAGDMLDTMSTIAVKLGHPGVEVFPKQKTLASDNDVGNWINIPYSNWEFPTRYAIINGEQAELEQFVEYATEQRLTPDEFYALEIEQEVEEMLTGAPPCLIALAQQTVSEGGRNTALYNFAVYCKQRWPDSWEPKTNEFNQTYINPALNNTEVMGVIKSIKRKDYFYTCNTPPIQQFCNKTICKKAEFGVGGAALPLIAPVFPDSMQKILTDPPIWIIGVEGDRIECSTDQLMNQIQYQKMIMEKLNKIHGNVKQPVWLKAISDLIATVEVINAPQEITSGGQVEYFLEDFLVHRPRAKDKKDVVNGMVWVESGLAHFVGNEFIQHLTQHRLNLPPNDVWMELRKLGGDTDQIYIGGKKNKRVWTVSETYLEQVESKDPEIDGAGF